MAYKGTSKIVAQVSVSCENCGNNFTYNHRLTGNASHSDEYMAMTLASQNLEKQIAKIKAGNYDSIAEHKPCQKCGYVQSWMITPVRKRRGMIWGTIFGVASYLLAFPVIVFLNNTPLHHDYLLPVIFCGFPIGTFFIIRAIVMFLYQPNMGKKVSPQTKVPNIEFKSPVEVDGSEWKCPKCGGTNPAKSKTCLGCNTPRPS
jgi:predicted RNA-binding Zn-ribbon protein involved in translation (DUF1610 family)